MIVTSLGDGLKRGDKPLPGAAKREACPKQPAITECTRHKAAMNGKHKKAAKDCGDFSPGKDGLSRPVAHAWATVLMIDDTRPGVKGFKRDDIAKCPFRL